jgi:carbamoyltransferase
MKNVLNEKIKLRETFRPFAPIVLKERVHEYFVWTPTIENPYMLFTAKVFWDKHLPSITHVDHSARLQIVDSKIHFKLHALLDTFYQMTKCPVLINTSFNVRGEPIVCTPLEALTCFMTTDIDILILENYLIRKTAQDKIQKPWKSAYFID